MEQAHEVIPEKKIETIQEMYDFDGHFIALLLSFTLCFFSILTKAKRIKQIFKNPLSRNTNTDHENNTLEMNTLTVNGSKISRHGFAFSQEEFGAVSQAQLVKAYETNTEC